MSARGRDTRSLAARCKKTLADHGKLKGIFAQSVKDDYVESSKSTIDGFVKSPDVLSMKKIQTTKRYAEVVVSFLGDDEESVADVSKTVSRLNKTENTFKKKNKKTTEEGDFFSIQTSTMPNFDSYYGGGNDEQAGLVMLFDRLSTSESE